MPGRRAPPLLEVGVMALDHVPALIDDPVEVGRSAVGRAAACAVALLVSQLGDDGLNATARR